MSEISFQNIIDHNGFTLCLTGLLIVFVALISISLFIAFVPKLLGILDKFFPEEPKEQAKPSEHRKVDRLENIAAIAYALHQERSN